MKPTANVKSAPFTSCLLSFLLLVDIVSGTRRQERRVTRNAGVGSWRPLFRGS